jgi:AGCS family alanine or glycine:cation symporter
LHALQEILSDVASFIWWPVLFLILGGGLFFLLHSGFAQYKYFVHAIQLLQGKHIDKDAPGQLSAYKALSTALASTVGMGNLAGVAAAIAMGGPGAMFWMWVTAIIGMSTNFYTSTLASLFRGKDSKGEVQGGPMYVIQEALGKEWKPLANFFCICCMIGCLPIFQANQLTQAILDIGLKPAGIDEVFIAGTSISFSKLMIGLVITALA